MIPLAKNWSRLDNAAKIFPPTSGKADTRVFRFSCTLTEPVDPEPLARALSDAMIDFPSFRYVLKRGLFWYYLEEGDFPATVCEEDAPPCAALYQGFASPLFAVTYYGARINLEVYHALTDATGALQFLRTLIYRYLLLRHPELARDGVPALDYDASRGQRMDDSFDRYYSGKRRRMAPGPVAYQLRGLRHPQWRQQVIVGTASASGLLQRARAMGATITELLAAILLLCIDAERPLRARRRPVVVTIPVNLRKYFDSASARNFFSVVNVGYDFCSGPATLEAVVSSVRESLRRALTPEALENRLNALGALERNPFMRAIPLFLKDPVMRLSCDIAERDFTASLSNVGRITMPEALMPFLERFDVYCATRKMQLCVCSLDDTLSMGFTTSLVSTDVQRRFFRALTAMDLDVTIYANHPESR